MTAVEANMSLKVIVCDIAFLNDDCLKDNPSIASAESGMRIDNLYFKQWLDLANHGDKRITLMNGRFEDLSDAIPDLVAQTDRERHAGRMQSVRHVADERKARGEA
jgi:hypothetical protein